MTSTERRASGFYKQFNDWYLERMTTERRPGSSDIAKWFSENAERVFGACMPTLKELVSHAKGLKLPHVARAVQRVAYRKRKAKLLEHKLMHERQSADGSCASDYPANSAQLLLGMHGGGVGPCVVDAMALRDGSCTTRSTTASEWSDEDLDVDMLEGCLGGTDEQYVPPRRCITTGMVGTEPSNAANTNANAAVMPVAANPSADATAPRPTVVGTTTDLMDAAGFAGHTQCAWSCKAAMYAPAEGMAISAHVPCHRNTGPSSYDNRHWTLAPMALASAAVADTADAAPMPARATCSAPGNVDFAPQAALQRNGNRSSGSTTASGGPVLTSMLHAQQQEQQVQQQPQPPQQQHQQQEHQQSQQHQQLPFLQELQELKRRASSLQTTCTSTAPAAPTTTPNPVSMAATITTTTAAAATTRSRSTSACSSSLAPLPVASGATYTHGASAQTRRGRAASAGSARAVVNPAQRPLPSYESVLHEAALESLDYVELARSCCCGDMSATGGFSEELMQLLAGQQQQQQHDHDTRLHTLQPLLAKSACGVGIINDDDMEFPSAGSGTIGRVASGPSSCPQLPACAPAAAASDREALARPVPLLAPPPLGPASFPWTSLGHEIDELVMDMRDKRLGVCPTVVPARLGCSNWR